MSGVRLGGRESDPTIPECGLAIMPRVSGDLLRYGVNEGVIEWEPRQDCGYELRAAKVTV